MLLESEIAEEYTVNGKQILTPNGWRDIKKVYKTIPLDVLVVITKNHRLECSVRHMIKTTCGWKEAGELTNADYVFTDTGKEEVLFCYHNGKMESLYDITIDDPSGEFYSNGIVSHNSTTFVTRQLILSHLIPRYKSLYVCPQHDQLKTYARRFAEMETAFRFPDGKQNLYNKVYSDGSAIDFNYCLTSANAVRGKSVIECVYIEEPVCCRFSTNNVYEYIPLKHIRSGAQVKSYDYTNGKYVYRTVKAYKYKGTRPCWKLHAANGTSVVCTDNHLVGTTSGWVCVAELLRYGQYDLSTNAGTSEETSHGEVDLITESGASKLIGIDYVGYLPVADIQVDDTACFFAGKILVHNCLLDEAQGLDPGIIPELLYVQTTAQYPSTIFAGTALTVDTFLESKWQASSMGMWHVRAMDDTNWINMYDKDTLLKVCDNPQGPTCPYTGKLLNVSNGCYVHANQKAMALNEIGIHVPQCIIPDLAYNPIQWGKIYKKIQTDDFNKVLQECFGIAVAEGTREISEQDLARLCVLPDTTEQLIEKCKNGYYRLIVSGCDWGGSDYNQAIKSKTSYTVHCIIGVAPDDTVDILYYRRFSGMDYRTIAAEIAATHNEFGAHLIASDFGVGLAYNTEIRDRIPFDRHFIMNYVGPSAAPLAVPKGQHMVNQLALNRTEALTNVFRDVKAPHLKIRARNWESMSQYLLDWLNMYRVPSELPSGQSTFKYIRSAQKADDALHAFTFAYVLAKFFLGEPLVDDSSLERRLRDVMYGETLATRSSSELDRIIYGEEPDYIISG